MKRPLPQVLLVVLAVALPAGAAAPKQGVPPFEELSGLIRSNLAGVTDVELDRAAAQGLLSHFKGRVALGNGKTAASAPLVSRPTVYEGAFAYVRLARVEDGAATKVAAAFARLGAKNKLKGLVLDLRYASGADYTAAGQVADLFLSAEQLLLDWGDGTAHSTAKQPPLNLPTAVLINGQTRGAAEALAAVLRQAGAALLVGNHTAGEASLFKEFTLADGQKVRIAAGTVKLGNGEMLSTKGVPPDIAVTVSTGDERAYFADAYKLLGAASNAVSVTNGVASATNRFRSRINEAELVRLQREGNLPDEDGPPPAIAGRPAPDNSAAPIVRDPALARALDLLKAIAIVQPAHAP